MLQSLPGGSIQSGRIYKTSGRSEPSSRGVSERFARGSRRHLPKMAVGAPEKLGR